MAVLGIGDILPVRLPPGLGALHLLFEVGDVLAVLGFLGPLLLPALDGLRVRDRTTGSRHRVKQPLGGAAGDHRVGDLIRVSLVCVTRLVEPLERHHALALLHDMRGLVCAGMEVGGARERDLVTGRERLGADRVGGGARGATDVGADAADVMAAERRLDLREVRQRTARSCDAGRDLGGLLCRPRLHSGGSVRLGLDRRDEIPCDKRLVEARIVILIVWASFPHDFALPV